MASDLTAAQLVLQFWTDWHPWVISLVFLVFLLGVNATSVHAYGEMGEYIIRIAVLGVLMILFRIHSFITQSRYDYHLHYSRYCR